MSLRNLSDREILSRIQELTRRERSLTLAVLHHLSEIERRRLHLKQGYASMFDYCTTGLAYSASAAMRRIRAARCIARFPEVYGLLESNEVNLSTISQVSRVLTPENKESVLTRIRGRSQREVEAIVAEYEPLAAIAPDRVRTVVTRVPVRTPRPPVNAAGVGLLSGELNPAERAQDTMPRGCGAEEEHNRNGCSREDQPSANPAGEYNRNGCATQSPADGPAGPGRAGEAAKFERRALIQFSAGEAFMAKLEAIRSLAWHRLPANPSLEQLFELAMDHFIEKEDPSMRKERRERSKERSQTNGGNKKEQLPAGMPSAAPRPPRPRHIAASVKDEVFTRDEGRCSYVGSSGRRCASTQALQVDHIHPIALGGRGTPSNLRLLCAFHNRLEAERILGTVGYAAARSTPPPAPGRGSSRTTPL